MMNCFIKSTVKKMLKIKLIIQYLFSKNVVNQEYKNALDNLNEIHSMLPINVETTNVIDIKYDLHIIIPCYNCEKYIVECINSIINQSTRYSCFLEIIDDGSTDSCKELLNQYNDVPSIKIVSQCNAGVSVARNKGIKTIHGKYIMFVDADDLLPDGAIDELLTVAFNKNADIVEGNNYLLLNNRIIKTNSSTNKSIVLENDGGPELRGTPWGKVIRADLFKKIEFPEGYYYEDSIFAYCIHPLAKRIERITNTVYLYRINNMGITRFSIGKKKAIDTYYLSVFLWENYFMNYSANRNFNLKVLNQVALNYSRTNNLDKDVLMNAFIYERNIYIGIFKETYDIPMKYQLLDKSIRQADFGRYEAICKMWFY